MTNYDFLVTVSFNNYILRAKVRKAPRIKKDPVLERLSYLKKSLIGLHTSKSLVSDMHALLYDPGLQRFRLGDDAIVDDFLNRNILSRPYNTVYGKSRHEVSRDEVIDIFLSLDTADVLHFFETRELRRNN